MSNQHLEVLRESFLDAADYEYTITAVDSDGTELGYIHGCDYEDLANTLLKISKEQKLVVKKNAANA